MTEKTRVYVVPQLLDDKTPRPDRYIEARSPTQAQAHVASDFFPVRVATHAELMAAMKAGTEIEKAGDSKKADG